MNERWHLTYARLTLTCQLIVIDASVGAKTDWPFNIVSRMVKRIFIKGSNLVTFEDALVNENIDTKVSLEYKKKLDYLSLTRNLCFAFIKNTVSFI